MTRISPATSILPSDGDEDSFAFIERA